MPDIATELAAAQQAYLDNAPPFTSTAQAAAFIKAASKLLILTPMQSGSREGNVSFDVKLISKEREDATKWLDANGGAPGFTPSTQTGSSGPSLTFAAFGNARGR
jgi:hypothetical protein